MAGNTERAAEELEKAIRILPEYSDAYNNLAVGNRRQGRFAEAAAETLPSARATLETLRP